MDPNITFNRENTPIIRVLLYHRILSRGSDRDMANIGVDEIAFRKQIEWLDKWGYTSITFADYSLFMKGELDLPQKPVIITFDDAYKDIYEHGFPVLMQYGMRAVVFVVADKSIMTSVWDEGIGEVFELLNQHEILEMNAAGFEVGSHTTGHPRLTVVNLELAREEIEQSKISLEILLNAPVRSFAYPFGLLNDQIKGVVRESGYSFACASFSGPPVFTDDLFEIRRIKVLNTSTRFVFWFQLQQIYIYYRWIRWAIRRTLFGFLRKERISDYDKKLMQQKKDKANEVNRQQS
jgi:peptidoglycan/xylan/chitin deacetylase (PgdA/CDA1 family)